MSELKAKPAPKRGSAPHQALERMYDAGGKVMVQSLINLVLRTRGRQSLLRERILEPLLERGMISVRGEVVHLLQPGYELMRKQRAQEPAESTPAPTVAPSRTPPTFRPLPPIVITPRREGAHDYRAIPSLMAGQRTPWKG